MRLHDIGARVAHSHYGDGTVTGANEYHTRIDFDAHGPRTFASSKVVLAPSMTAAPAKKAAPRRKRAAAAATAAA